MSGSSIKVPGRTIVDIRSVADDLRKGFRLTDSYFPIDTFLENFLPTIWDDFVFRVRENKELGNDHGRTMPDLNRIEVRLDVFEGACRGEGRDRFTLAHELGHLLLHKGVITLNRSGHFYAQEYKKFECSEWQANTFASELLMPVNAVRVLKSPIQIPEIFGVSNDAARVRWNKLGAQGLLKKQ